MRNYLELGMLVVVPEPNDTDIHSHEFVGGIIGGDVNVSWVEDSEGDVYCIENERLLPYIEN